MGKESELTFLQGSYRNGQETHEKKGSIPLVISASQNHIKYYFAPSRMAIIKIRRMNVDEEAENQNSHTLLVGM